MNLLEQAKHIPDGIVVIGKWLGSGGEVVSQEVAQERADVCLKCPMNQHGFSLADPVALAVKQYLEVKNKIGLHVKGEKLLGTCTMCGCALRLKVHEPTDKVKAELTDEEKAKAPAFCWQINAALSEVADKKRSDMDRQKALDELKIAQGNGDIEMAHASADEVICRLLSALGYQDVVDEWEKVDKWYA